MPTISSVGDPHETRKSHKFLLEMATGLGKTYTSALLCRATHARRHPLRRPCKMQVRRLREALGEEVAVESVDRFQGREARVVIVSMCASDLDGAARGSEFLLDRNRLNVALSRAQSLAIVVGNPVLGEAACSSVEQ